MDWTGCEWVESVPERLSGTLVLIGTRMPADGVLDNFNAGLEPEEIARDFGVDLQSVRGAWNSLTGSSMPRQLE